MRFAVAGLGGAFLRGHLPALRRLEAEGRLELVGVAERNASRRATAATWLPGLPTFACAEAMLASLDPDVFVIATEPSDHCELAALGARHARHIVCEKPLALTHGQLALLADACRARPNLGLVSIHQYRYSPAWQNIAAWARLAHQMSLPFALDVDVGRDGSDRQAVSSWRADLASSGGMLADHGVHFLALAWTIGGELDVVAGSRSFDAAGREQSSAAVRVGSGSLSLRVSAASPTRRTEVRLKIEAACLAWRDEWATFSVGESTIHRWRARAISDRGHVDGLYLDLYRDIVTNIGDAAWRDDRTLESLQVADALIAALELTEQEVAVP